MVLEKTLSSIRNREGMLYSIYRREQSFWPQGERMVSYGCCRKQSVCVCVCVCKLECMGGRAGENALEQTLRPPTGWGVRRGSTRLEAGITPSQVHVLLLLWGTSDAFPHQSVSSLLRLNCLLCV